MEISTTYFRFHTHLQAKRPYPRQVHALVNSVKPGALASPLPAQTGNKKVTVNNKCAVIVSNGINFRI